MIFFSKQSTPIMNSSVLPTFSKQFTLTMNSSALPTFLTNKRIDYVSIQNEEMISLFRNLIPEKGIKFWWNIWLNATFMWQLCGFSPLNYLLKIFWKLLYAQTRGSLQLLNWNKMVSRKLLKFFESYLRNRKQRLVLNGCYSDYSEIEYGVPNGSVLVLSRVFRK